MAPKLPPPANTKAVFAGFAWLDTDKPRSLPGVDARTISHATFGRIYSSRRTHDAINNVCCDERLFAPGSTGAGVGWVPALRAPPCGHRQTGAAPRPGHEWISVRQTPFRSRNDRARCGCLRENHALQKSG